MDNGARKNNSNLEKESARSSVTPGFEGGTGGGETPSGLSNKKVIGKSGGDGDGGLVSQNNRAADSLNAGEERTANEDNLRQPEDSLDGARKNEETAGGYYLGASRVKKDEKSGQKVKGKGRGRKWAAAMILALVLGTGALMGGSQLMQPFAIVSQFTEQLDSMHVSTNTRSNVFFRMQMNPNSRNIKNPKKTTFFGKEKFKISELQSSRLANQGIYYEQDFEGTGVSVLKFDDGTGKMEVVVVGDADAEKVNAKLGSGLADSATNLEYDSKAVKFNDVYKSNSDFYNGYNKGSLTWRGKIANWFGTTTANFLDSNSITRNLFRNYIEKVRAAQDGNTRTVALDMIGERADKVNGVDVTTTDAKQKEEKVDGEMRPVFDEDGNPVFEEFNVDNAEVTTKISGESRANVKKWSLDNVKGKLNEIKQKFDGSGKVSGAASGAANLVCAGLSFVGTVSMMVTASEALQIINLVAAFFESVDKVKVEEGDNSPINELATTLNEKKKNVNTVIKQKDGVSVGALNEYGVPEDVNETNGIPTLETEEVSSEKTAMEAGMMASFFGGGQANPNDPSIQSFNLTNSINRVLGGIGTSMAAFEGCSLTKMAAGIAQTATNAAEIIACIAGVVAAPATAFTSIAACSGLIVDFAVGVGFGIAIGALLGGLVTTLAPVVKNMLTRDLISDIGGEDLGNALAIGANMYIGGTHRSNGGSLMTRSKYVEFAAAQQKVIAEDARYERETRDPFDATSKYTFLGTLMNKLMSFSTASSLTSVIKSSSSIVNSSIVALTPTAAAEDIAEDLMPEDQFAEACPYLDSIGAIGDAACQPYVATDISTIEYDPSEVIEVLDDNFLEETTSDGNVQIKASSDLAKYILFCDNRESTFGIADQNIVSEVSDWGAVNTGSEVFDNVSNATIGAAPVVGDVVDVVSNAEALANSGYVSGEAGVAGNTMAKDDVVNTETPDWGTAQYYQRFIEDQSLAESMGLIEESAVTSFLNDYYKEHPLDNSYEGILARYSGLEKEDVIALLEIIEYGEYLANYDPTERYAFAAPAVEVKKELRFDNDNEVADNNYMILLNQISFSDLRNRNFAV